MSLIHIFAIVIMVSIVIFGGVKVISNVGEKLVPFMAIAYIWGCVVILGICLLYTSRCV